MASIGFNGLTNYITAPTQIPGLGLWIDASDSNTVDLTGGSNIITVRDKSSNGYLFSNASGFTYNQVKFNGTYPSFYAGNYVNRNNLGSNPSAIYTQPLTVFHVGQYTTGAGYIMDGTNTNNRIVIFSQGGNLYAFNQVNGTANLGNNYVLTARFNSNASFAAVNGTNYLTNVNVGTYTLGAGTILASRFSLSEPYGGHYCELLFYRGILTTQQQQQVEGYLAWKWGLANNLPQSHPFRFSANNPGYVGTLPTQTLMSYSPLSYSVPITSGLALWLDAADQTTVQLVPSTTNVSNWRDKSGNSRNAIQATSSNQPTYNNSFLSFNGSSQFMISPLTASSNTETVFAVVLLSNNVGQFNTILGPNAGPAGGRQFDIVQSATTSFRFELTRMNQAIPNQITVTQTAGTIFLTNYINSGSSSTLYRNGTSLNTSLTPTAFTGSFTTSIGSRGVDLNANFFGNMYEIIVYNNVLSDSARQQVEGYLAWKWGLQATLPTSHPYYFNPLVPVQVSLPQSVLSYYSFTPRSISGLTLWLDAADQTTIQFSPGTANVSNWIDKSGSNNSATNTVASNQPVYITSSAGNYLSFNSALSQFLTFANPNNLVVNTTFTVMFVEKRQNSSQNYILGGATQATNQNLHVGYTNNLTIRFAFYGNDLNTSISGFTTTTNEPTRIWAFDYNGSTRSIITNGSLLGSGSNTANLTSYTGGAIGRYAGIAIYTGNIYEILIFRPSISSTQRQQVEGYLAWKWGLTGSLAPGHPNQYMPP